MKSLINNPPEEYQKLSSNVNEVIRAVLNSLFYFIFCKKILHAPKVPKSTKTQPSKSTKHYKHTKIKNALKKH